MSRNSAKKRKNNMAAKKSRKRLGRSPSQKTQHITEVSNVPVDGVDFADEVVAMITNAKMALLLAMKDGKVKNNKISKNKFLAKWAATELISGRATEGVKNQLVSMASCGSGVNLHVHSLESYLDAALSDYEQSEEFQEFTGVSFHQRLKNTFDMAEAEGWSTDLGIVRDWKKDGPVTYEGQDPYLFTVNEHHINFNDDGSMAGPVSIFTTNAGCTQTINLFKNNGLLLFDKQEVDGHATYLILPGNLGGKLRNLCTAKVSPDNG